jgi:recombinational DNA repair protein (RecF pathway)
MSHQTYTTEALVCGGYEHNTSDKSYLLFTKTAGMIYANARSVREERSKQRCALQEFSRLRISLIKGRSGWRIGSVESSQNDFALAMDRETRGSVVMMYKTLRRFIKGEEASPELFDFCIGALDELIKQNEHRKFLESFVQLQILFRLGYVDNKVIPSILQKSHISEIHQHQNDQTTKEFEELINHAIENSQL